jgi:pimeloyl-ACP methyl ester carboxylesterase
MRASRSLFIPVRGLRYHARIWGDAAAPKLFLLHGWMDSSATFQFLVDALREAWYVIAPDWRGYGRSEWTDAPYWFPDYLADLDALLDHFSERQPTRIVGHSMGGNIACLYAGVRPDRVRALATLEGLGLPASDPAQAPARYRKWLDQLRSPPQPGVYADVDALAERLRRDNPRLGEARARFLAANFHRETSSDGVIAEADAWHRVVFPVMYRLEEAKSCWREVVAPVLWVVARESRIVKTIAADRDDYRARLGCFRDLTEVVLDDCGHMMQHDQPETLAKILEDFLRPHR